MNDDKQNANSLLWITLIFTIGGILTLFDATQQEDPVKMFIYYVGGIGSILFFGGGQIYLWWRAATPRKETESEVKDHQGETISINLIALILMVGAVTYGAYAWVIINSINQVLIAGLIAAFAMGLHIHTHVAHRR